MTEYSRGSIRENLAQAGLARVSRGKAIRAKCLDCTGGNSAEVARCHIVGCALWPFRFGMDPFSERKPSAASLKALARHRGGS
jgi:hypothetical protein